MDGDAAPSMGSAAGTRVTSRRRRPLHTCGVSLIAVAGIAFTKSQKFEWIGPKVKRMGAFCRPVKPFIKASEYLWPPVLFFLDSYILAVEKLTEFLFPPSTRLFNKIDELVLIVEAFPRELDGAINRFPFIIRQYPHLDYAVAKVTSWLKFFLASFRSELDNTREKDIMIDVPLAPSPPSHAKSKSKEKLPLASDTPQLPETAADGSTCNYKHVLEKRTEENVGSKGDDETVETVDSEKEKIMSPESEASIITAEVTEENIESKGDYDNKEAAGEKEGGNVMKTNQLRVGDEDFLQLFESIWHLSPSKKD